MHQNAIGLSTTLMRDRQTDRRLLNFFTNLMQSVINLMQEIHQSKSTINSVDKSYLAE